MLRIRTSLLALALAPSLLSPFPLVAAPPQLSGEQDGVYSGARPLSTRAGPTYDGGAGELEVATPRLSGPTVQVDGLLDEEAWAEAAVLEGFTQYEPSEGVPASQRTEAFVFVSGDALYLGVRAWDTDPKGIRATLTERDAFDRSDDYVRLVLDTFNDQRRAYVFTVNPYGVQHDGLWVEGAARQRGMGHGPPIDDNPDFLWDSDATLQPWGWSAEIRIPFKTLRFPDRPLQAWGVNVVRRVQRTGFEESWAPITSDVASRLSQSGTLAGLRDLDPGLFLELNPVLTGKRVGEWDDEAADLVRDDPEAEFGANVTYGLTSNLTLDATYNPDFSQVEADAGQIAVNERFALFFPEKRPFFLEGTEVFSLPAQLVYTRSIVNPLAGAKLTGKVGSLNMGYLGAWDRALDDDEEDAAVNLLRLRRDLGATSTLGALYTDRTRSRDAYNRVGAVDGRFVFGERYTLALLGAGSWTGSGEEAATEAGSYLMGQLQRAGRTFSLEAEFEDAAPGFEAGSGFIRRVGEARVQLETRYNHWGAPGDLLEQWSPSLQVQGWWDHDRFWEGARFQEGQVQLGSRVSFRNNLTVSLTVQRDAFNYPADAYDGLYVEGDGEGEALDPLRPAPELFEDLWGGRLFFFFSNWERVRGNARVEWSEVPIFERGFGVPVEPGRAWSGQVSLELFPVPRLQGELEIRHETILRERDGSRYSRATIPRLRAQYQFSKALFVRTILEYASQERGALLDPRTGRVVRACDDTCEVRSGADDFDIHVEALVSYEPSPGTVVFVGYSRDMIDREAFGFRAVEPRADGLFAKVSYRFRF